MNELGNGPWDKDYQPSGISKAEERSLEAYPEVPGDDWVSINKDSSNYHDRRPYIEGYEQAEKDLSLTIQDLELLHTFLYAVKNNKHGCFTFTRLSDEQYAEVLKRFTEAKK